jgi:hypothetical protein
MLKYFLLITAALISFTLVLIFAGCEGAARHHVDTGGAGSLAGLVITPEPQKIGIATDTVFYLDWRPGYEPPAELTISLRSVDPDNTTAPIYTILDDLDPYQPGHYRLEPSWYLPTGTFLLLTVYGDGERMRAMYLTEPSSLFSTTTRRREGGQAEHTVKRK